ncbi:hypothetical protein G647_07882 [Cladophialophora carrionii CBS 160.54]|uniref:G-patch domain-containing protein n=1 Tax=Cladophialophora carrionii CBS 160.54 TaxID=1279043 RepID=V9D3U5_9EURO|nr:uncharacterized protein G647_07882 [Cladophialophora carrionii CBS 160.54]ETI21535.1 hypothetical protein G647_07882 [Cladophialophora carrionii CBS 160.54]
MPDSGTEDEDYFLPLQDQRVFGAGIKRKRINFVRASTVDPTTTLPPSTASPSASDVSSRYLSIVLPGSRTEQGSQPKKSTTARANESSPERCPVCAEPLTSTSSSPSTHESSLAHQVCLQHVHPPSHLPRSHVGVRYLSSYGWDPDARRGLGAREEGITAPIKATRKNDTAGLRERIDRDDDEHDHAVRTRTTTNAKKKRLKGHETQETVAPASAKSDAKQVRIRDAEARKRAERLRANFYGPDLERYLGPEPSTA